MRGGLNWWLIFNSLSRGTAAMPDRTWIESGSDWLKITPFGFRKLLKFIKDEYGNPPIYVTENGVSERGAVDLNDVHRTYFYKNYINQGLKGIVIHVNSFFTLKVIHYTCFSELYCTLELFRTQNYPECFVALEENSSYFTAIH